MAKKILFTGGRLLDIFEQMLTDLGYSVRNEERADISENELRELLPGVSAYILGGEEKVTAKILEEHPDLEIIAFLGTGYESYIDVKAATLNGIAISHTPGANATSVAEFTFGLILAAVKRIAYLSEITALGRGQTYQTWNLQGRTIGIVGMGAVGSRVAYIAHRGFDMQVLYTSRNRKPHIETELKAKMVGLENLLSSSDIVSLHPSDNEENSHMIRANQLALLKPHAVLINTARAKIVEPHALYNLLIEQKIWGAAFDVYYKEPVPSPSADQYGLVTLSKEYFILTPHTAYKTEDALQAMTEMCVNSILAVFNAEQNDYIVNPEYENYRRGKVV